MGKGEDTKQAILGKAINAASVYGLGGLSIGGLAGAMGMSKSGLFAHFGSKDALQRAVLDTVVEDFRVNVVGPVLRLSTGEQRLRALFKSWMDWTSDHYGEGGCPLIMASIELDDQPGPLRDQLVAAQRDWVGAIARMAQKAIDEGSFAKHADPNQFAFEFQSIGLGYNHARRLLKDPAARQRVDAAFESLMARFAA